MLDLQLIVEAIAAFEMTLNGLGLVDLLPMLVRLLPHSLNPLFLFQLHYFVVIQLVAFGFNLLMATFLLQGAKNKDADKCRLWFISYAVFLLMTLNYYWVLLGWSITRFAFVLLPLAINLGKLWAVHQFIQEIKQSGGG